METIFKQTPPFTSHEWEVLCSPCLSLLPPPERTTLLPSDRALLLASCGSDCEGLQLWRLAPCQSPPSLWSPMPGPEEQSDASVESAHIWLRVRMSTAHHLP